MLTNTISDIRAELINAAKPLTSAELDELIFALPIEYVNAFNRLLDDEVDRRADKFEAAAARILERCEPQDNGCLVWSGPTTAEGYGITGDGFVHRVVYTAVVGPIKPGLVIDHVAALGCTSKACCAIAHLQPVTQAENARRSTPIGTSGFRGVSRMGTKWQAFLNVDGRKHYAGSYSTAEAAAEVARQARIAVGTPSDDDDRPLVELGPEDAAKLARRLAVLRSDRVVGT